MKKRRKKGGFAAALLGVTQSAKKLIDGVSVAGAAGSQKRAGEKKDCGGCTTGSK